MLVKVGRMPGRIEEIAVEDNASVRDVLEIAGLDAEGYEIRVNGSTKELGEEVQDGSVVLLTKMIKGNANMIVKIGKMPGRIEEIALEDGTTVQQALEIVGLDSEGYEIRVNGTTSTTSAELSDGNVVLLTKMIKGNR